jgi:hypothetical protein
MTGTLTSMPPRKKKPVSDEQEPKKKATDTVRVDADLADKLATIRAILKIDSADLISPLIRDAVEQKFQEAKRKVASM